MHNVRWPTTQDRVILVLAGCGVTLRSALLQTHNFFETKVPAARALAEVATNRTKIANLRCSNRMRRFGKTWKIATYHWVLFKLSQRDQRADAQSAFAVCYDPIEPPNTFKINQARRPRDVILHRGQKILPARNWSRGIVCIIRRWGRLERADGFGDAVWTHPLESFHALLLIRPTRILSGVMGKSRTRTPQALKTALAKAPSAGMMQASAIPITTSRLSSSSMSGTNSGISREPGSL